MVSCIASMMSHGVMCCIKCHIVSCVASMVSHGVMCCINGVAWCHVLHQRCHAESCVASIVSCVMFCINGCHVLAPMSVTWCHVLCQWSTRVVVCGKGYENSGTRV